MVRRARRRTAPCPTARGAVEFWDITNKQDWAACESVQRGLGQPALPPGPVRAQGGRGRRLRRRGSAAPTRTGGSSRDGAGAAGRRASSWCSACVQPASSTARPRGRRGEARRQAGAHQGRLPHAAHVRRAAARAVRLDPAALGPGAARRRARVRVGFAFVPARARTGRSARVVPHEGGPGYSTTSSASYYAPMYGPLLEPAQPAARRPARHRSLAGAELPGPAGPHDRLQRGRRPVRPLARARAPTTTRPRCSADDLAVVLTRLGLGTVDVYGDSYGTFFTAGVHRSPPRPGAQRRPRRRLPDVRRVRVVPDPGPGDAARLRPRLSPLGACRDGGRSFLPTLRAGAGRRCARTRGAVSRTTPTGGAPA